MEARPRVSTNSKKLIAEIEDRERCLDTRGRSPWPAPSSPSTIRAKAKIERGFVRPEDMPKTRKAKKTRMVLVLPATKARRNSPLVSPPLSSRGLTAHKICGSCGNTARCARTRALPPSVYALVLDVFRHRHDTALKLFSDSAIAAARGRLDRVPASRSRPRKPGASVSLALPPISGAGGLEQDQAVLLDLLTFCAACTLNGVQMKADRPDAPRLAHAGQLAAVLHLDMTAWFTADPPKTTSIASARFKYSKPCGRRDNSPRHRPGKSSRRPNLPNSPRAETAATGWLPLPLRQ